jgi:hypothetical protein
MGHPDPLRLLSIPPGRGRGKRPVDHRRRCRVLSRFPPPPPSPLPQMGKEVWSLDGSSPAPGGGGPVRGVCQLRKTLGLNLD